MKKVLVIDGGGVRGIAPLFLLDCIQNEIASGNIIDKFDMICGTSTGGLISSLVSTNGNTISSTLELYRRHSKEIFRKPLTTTMRLRGKKHDHAVFEGLLNDIFGTSVIGDLNKKIIITSYDMEDCTPFFMRNWDENCRDVPVSIAVRATTASPTFFEPITVNIHGNIRTLVDGGIYINNPSMVAYVEAKMLWPNEEILLMSLGTGMLSSPNTFDKIKNWSILQWIEPLIVHSLDGNSKCIDYQLTQLLGNRLYARYSPDIKGVPFDDSSEQALNNLMNSTYRLFKGMSLDFVKEKVYEII